MPVCRRLATTSRVSSRCARWPTRRSSRRASAGRQPSWSASCSPQAGVDGIQAHPTPDGSLAVIGRTAGPEGAPTVLLYSHYDVVPVGDLDRLGDAAMGADRARRALVRKGIRGLQGQPRRHPARPASPAGGARRVAGRGRRRVRGVGGAVERRDGGAGACAARPRGVRRPAAGRHRQRRGRAADPDHVAARHGQRADDGAHHDPPGALRHVRRRRRRTRSRPC